MLDRAAAFQISPSSVIHEDSSHQLRGHRKEMGAVLPAHSPVVDESNIRLVDQRRSLNAVGESLPPHVLRR